ncbi:MAG: hypothetical protein Q8878_09475, partial [Bacillota bacterium]|nr:hypothetical protein [Bacillota bacterium]
DGAVLIKIKNGSLKETGRIPANREENYGGGDEPFTRRLLYIGDTLYYLRDGMLRAFDYNTLKEKSGLVLS